MELRHLRYVIAIAEEGTVTRAAARLRMQQPPLSQQLRDLERELGFSLFDRSRKGVEPTAAGAVFLDEARERPRPGATRKGPCRPGGRGF